MAGVCSAQTPVEGLIEQDLLLCFCLLPEQKLFHVPLDQINHRKMKGSISSVVQLASPNNQHVLQLFIA